jgi:hypothetical protein
VVQHLGEQHSMRDFGNTGFCSILWIGSKHGKQKIEVSECMDLG